MLLRKVFIFALFLAPVPEATQKPHIDDQFQNVVPAVPAIAPTTLLSLQPDVQQNDIVDECK